MIEIDSFFVHIKAEDDYMAEKGRYQIISEENEVNMQFKTKKELIDWIDIRLLDIN